MGSLCIRCGLSIVLSGGVRRGLFGSGIDVGRGSFSRLGVGLYTGAVECGSSRLAMDGDMLA